MKSLPMRTPFSIAVCSLAAAPALAADLDLSIQIPQLDVAEYHRPYVAAWIEKEDRSVASNLAVWYQQKKAGAPGVMAPPAAEGKPAEGAKPPAGPQAEGGTKWLPDLRQWWRRSGRELSLPVDGVSGPTRAVGEQKLSFSDGKAPLGSLAAGKYKLVVEAVREDGGREFVDIPFEWPATAATELKANGKSELGAVTLSLKP